ncbi:MAG TPA: outer membrane beta-barrel protein [Ferruginibacter sp.]|nr:outer membrane beta-barrel protein [Ferruginibacter sp.]HMP20883.1 outer membrane beta-barrel protein [Ferruginibacter sp.]
MPENNFEKQVNALMEGFTVQPSEQPWQKIEPQITNREKRRRGILYLCLLLTLLTGWGIYSSINTTTENALAESHTTPAKKTTVEPVNTQKLTNPAVQPKIPAVVPAAQIPITKNIIQQPATAPAANSTVQQQPYKNGSTAKRIQRSSTTTTSVVTASIDELIETGQAVQPVAIDDTEANGFALSEKALLHPADTTLATDTACLESAVVKAKTDTAGSITSTTIRQTKGWTFWAQVAGGVGATGTGYQSQLPASGYYFGSLSNEVSQGGGPFNSAIRSASLIRRGASFSAGIHAQNTLSSRWAISTGMQYRYLSTAIAVNKRNDSIVAGNTGTYNNAYHFVMVPVTLQLTAGFNHKLPLYLQAGVHVGLLVGTNALQFDNRTGNYYADNDIFNTMQAGIHAAAAINLRNKKHLPLLIGPVLEYSLTPVAAKGFYGNTHYSFIGLQVKQQLGKK